MLGFGSLPIGTASRLTDLYPRHFIHALSHRRNYKLDVGIRSCGAGIILQVSAHRMRCSCRCKCPPLSACLRACRESNRASPLRGRAGGCAEAPRAGLPPRGRPSLTQDGARLPIATTAHLISQISKPSSTPQRVRRHGVCFTELVIAIRPHPVRNHRQPASSTRK
jgi:hypothetical protein